MWETWLFQYANPLRVSCEKVGQNQSVGSNNWAVYANDREHSSFIGLPITVDIKPIPELVGSIGRREPIRDKNRGPGRIEKVLQVLVIV
jgi:hypothetical protein